MGDWATSNSEGDSPFGSELLERADAIEAELQERRETLRFAASTAGAAAIFLIL